MKIIESNHSKVEKYIAKFNELKNGSMASFARLEQPLSMDQITIKIKKNKIFGKSILFIFWSHGECEIWGDYNNFRKEIDDMEKIAHCEAIFRI